MNKKIPKPTIPTKYIPLPDDELLDSNSVAWIWGISRSSVSANVKSGRIPKPDVRLKDGLISNLKNYWKLGTIRKFIVENQ